MNARLQCLVLCSGAVLLASAYAGHLVMHQVRSQHLTEAVAGAVKSSYAAVQPGQNAAASGGFSSAVRSGTPVDEELLWLARCIYSETKRPVEQLLVAWVVRNRVETQYHGLTSYRAVIQEPYQFSAFNSDRSNARMTTSSDSTGWKEALRIARYVMEAPRSERPFSIITRHFYSERSMPDRRAPDWSTGVQVQPVEEHQIDSQRFRFYSGIF